MTDDIADHYANDGIAERVLEAVRAALPPDALLTPEALSSADHLHSRGLVATEELAALLDPQPGDRILDIGSGVGGPARWIAATFDAHVTGIDLTEAFCKAALTLNAATGMSDRVAIVQASALDLPFPHAHFDRALSHNVIMNIADKARFYAEAYRVLKPGGALALMNLIAGPTGTPHYPTPWAASAASSFLATLDETRAQIEAAGFRIVTLEDTTGRTRTSRQAQAQQIRAGAIPVLGAHLVMGSRVSAFRLNTARSEEEGSLRSMAALVLKPV